MLKTAGMGAGAFGKAALNNVLSSKSGGTALARTAGNLLTGGFGGALSQAKTGIKGLTKSGFRAIGEHFKNKSRLKIL